MANYSNKLPKGPDDDGMTYLPIDRSGATEAVYTPTHPRETNAIGGMKIGEPFHFVSPKAMPQLELTAILQACQSLISGRSSYKALIYLHRAQLADIQILWQATQHEELKTRWERLWVISPILARLSRLPESRPQMAEMFLADIEGLHLLGKFSEQDHPAVKRLFSRLKERLLEGLLKELVLQHKQIRQAMKLAGIVANLETDEEKLQGILDKLTDSKISKSIMRLLYVKYRAHKEDLKTVSSKVLRKRLESWRR